VTTHRLPFVITLYRPLDIAPRYVGRFDYLAGPGRLPLLKPPWGSVVAIDMSRGEHRWRAPVGDGPRNHPALANANVTERLGWPTRSFALATRSLLIVVQMGYRGPARPAPFSPRRRVNDLFNLEPKLYAYDKATGKLLAEIPLPANATGAPMTYMVNGKQYIAFSVGGSNLTEELIALRLPSTE
jgi:quinoprotein glucose dehydrogenase